MFQAEGTIVRVQTLADRSLKVIVETQELPPEANAKLFGLFNKIGWFVFKADKINPEDVADLPEVGTDTFAKSPSQLLRSVLYANYKALDRRGKVQETFDIWYRRTMEQIRQAYIGRINELKEKDPIEGESNGAVDNG